ncbi:hypothetical protein CH305_16970 [Rhodococcus sp. 15-649-2-2]|nr:hypothetical protein CH305_16970 [Rhodococcus sp. 15-649-2-2]
MVTFVPRWSFFLGVGQLHRADVSPGHVLGSRRISPRITGVSARSSVGKPDMTTDRTAFGSALYEPSVRFE